MDSELKAAAAIWDEAASVADVATYRTGDAFTRGLWDRARARVEIVTSMDAAMVADPRTVCSGMQNGERYFDEHVDSATGHGEFALGAKSYDQVCAEKRYAFDRLMAIHDALRLEWTTRGDGTDGADGAEPIVEHVRLMCWLSFLTGVGVAVVGVGVALAIRSGAGL